MTSSTWMNFKDICSENVAKRSQAQMNLQEMVAFI